MSTEENKALARRVYEETLNRRNLVELNEFYVPDFVYHGTSRTIQGVEALKQALSLYFSAFPDLRLTMEDLIAEGDRVVVRFTYRGTHTGDFRGMPPIGKQLAVPGIGIMRVVNGKILEEWVNQDPLPQLGVVAAPGQATR
jgi:steroid delta-isomerase-like uncharacterized protein